MHAGMVRRLVVDKINKRLITAGDDKTLRIWQLPGGRLLRVLRVPIGSGYEGRVSALAVTPDGKFIVGGGWTGWEWDNKVSLYIFDAETGDMVRRVRGFPENVGELTYSSDGRYLAVGLTANAGLRVLRTSDYSIVAQDTEYGDKILGTDFAPDGRLAVAGVDGLVRIYDAQFHMLGRKQVKPGKKPMVVRFSPDGSKLAVSFDDVPLIAVYASVDMTPLYTTDERGVAHQSRMSDTAWSADGEYLYGCGEYRGTGKNPVYRWSNAGRGPVEKFPVAAARITDVRQMPGGGVAYATEDPSIGIISRAGEQIFAVGTSLADFRDAGSAFEVSQDGSVIRYPYFQGGRRIGAFSLYQHSLNVSDAAKPEPTRRIVPASVFGLENWKDSTAPTLSGKRIPLDDYEVVRSYSISPDQQILLLGTEWALRAYDRKGASLWSKPAPGVVWNVAITGDGKTVVATISDGTIRWYRIEDGEEYAAFFPHANGEDWIMWIPRGYYQSSNLGDNYIGWHLNRGKEAAADFYRAVQFERVLYRPDLVESAFRLRGGKNPTSGNLAQFDVSQLSTITPPRIRVTAKPVESRQPGDAAQIDVRFTAANSALPMQDFAVYVNDIPVTPAQQRSLAGGETTAFSRAMLLDVSEAANLVRIEAFNGRALGLAETYVDLPAKPTGGPAQGDLFLLAIGAKHFPGLANAELNFPDRDAEELARLFAQQGHSPFRQVFIKTITDHGPTLPNQANIVEGLKFIEKAQAHDTVVLFLASHGISDVGGNYFFVPRDAKQEDVDAVLLSSTPPRAQSLIGWSTFFEVLRKTAGRRVVFVDTCHARSMEGNLHLHSLAKRSASSNFALVVASKGKEESQEYTPGKHGLFTYALLQALGGEADVNKDGLITLAEAFQTALPLVERLRSKEVGLQTPELVASEPLRTTVLVKLMNAPAQAAAPAR